MLRYVWVYGYFWLSSVFVKCMCTTFSRDDNVSLLSEPLSKLFNPSVHAVGALGDDEHDKLSV